MYALAFLAAVAAQAQPVPPRSTDVRIGVETVHVPFPDGYCEPTGKTAAALQLLAAADDRSVTHLTLVNCDPTKSESDYLIMKTPIQALNLEMGLPEFIAEISQQMNAPELKVALQSGELDRQVSERLAEVSDAPVELKSDFRGIGHDEACVYMGGTGVETFEGKSYARAMGACATVAARRPFNLYAYQETNSREAYKALLPKVKAWALKIHAAQ